MTFSVTMPQLGESVTEGTVTRWLKQVGDQVAADEPLLEVSTDKVDTEIPSPAAGVLLAIRAQEDETVLVGAELAVIGAASEAPAPAPAPAPTAAPVAPASTQGAAEVSITLPALGESVTEGTVTRWLKQVGDTVAADEPILEISTDKVDTEILAPASGTLVAITVGEDQTVAVGTELGRIATGASAPAIAAPVAAAPVAAAELSDAYVTPLVRRLAAQNNIDLATLAGTGVGGRIRKQDVLDAAQLKVAPVAAAAAAPVSPAPVTAATPPASPLRGRTEKMPRLRKVIAERLVESLQTSAQLTTVIEVDVSRIASLRNRVKGEFEAREGVKLSFLPFFCKAAVEALKQFPQVNASIDMAEGTITYHDSENLGIAVDTERGLLVPVIQHAGDLSIAGLARHIADVADRTRTNKVSPDELSGGTFTVTNTGSRGALFDTPIINLPQVAILGTGAVVKRPIVVTDSTGQDVIAIRSMVYLALSYDHRIIDGADAARFLGTMRQRLEEASFEAELGL
ncbi:dihydrolipoamide acetyltransferase component of pyruvate dehydrogenase complex [Actinomycetes bacterium]|nr:dihydrolipoamide acetyltransferase component of pyruvate dehydrogenase complex [Actinomycetes bacterium]